MHNRSTHKRVQSKSGHDMKTNSVLCFKQNQRTCTPTKHCDHLDKTLIDLGNKTKSNQKLRHEFKNNEMLSSQNKTGMRIAC